MTDCLFCKIVAKEIPATIEFEDEKVIVIHDIHPKAPLHALVIPKEHILESMNDVETKHAELLAHMFTVAKSVATKYGSDKYGYKLIFNVGQGGGQTIMHLHLHVLGKKSDSDKLPSMAE